MNYTVLESACGCITLLRKPDAIDLPIITEISSKDQEATDYYPLQSEDENYIFVPENVEDMVDPVKISEIADAPAFNAMSMFTGIQDNGDGTYTNYNFTPAQLLTYVLSQTRTKFESNVNGVTVTVPWLNGREATEISTGGQSYIIDLDFTQTGNDLTLLNGNSFYETQKMIIRL